MTMTASQAMRPVRLPRIPASDPHGWVNVGRRLAVAAIGSLIALGTLPVETLGGIDGDPEDDAPAGNRPDSAAPTAA